MKKISKLIILILIGVLGGIGGSRYLESEPDHEEETY
ncbi:hypothetical protein SPSF3K_00700 [Streptococcus parauberis]|nr:hypothetical protein SPSF3K_00700 [Streptococcus parauberis]